MALTCLLLLVFWTGGALSCLNDERCADMHTVAMAALRANDMTEFCRLRSRSIACYSGDVYDCPDADASMEPMYTGYYNTCSLSAAVIQTCKQKSLSCYSHLQPAVDHLSNSDIPSYCSAMPPYLSCVNNSMSSCDSHVTMYDVMGSVLTTYERFCGVSADKSQVCQGIIYSAGCTDLLSNITDSLTNMDFTLYCSQMDKYMMCFDQAFKGCDQSLSKESIMGGLGQSYKQYCPGGAGGSGGSGDPVQVCQAKAYSCYPTMIAAVNNTDNPVAMCRGLSDYFSCVKGVMTNCDSSVKQTQLVGPKEDSFNMICGGGVTGGYCPGVATCTMTMMSTPTLQPSSGEGEQGELNISPQNPNIIQDCSKLGTVMSCLDTQLSACNYTSPRNYRFNDISTLFVTGCQTLGTDTELGKCSQVTTCMRTYNFPTDLKEIGQLYYDPQFWCSLLKSTVVCAQAADQCQSDHSKYTTLLSEVNQVCPEAKVLVTLSGSAVSRAGISTVIGSIIVLLITQL